MVLMEIQKRIAIRNAKGLYDLYEMAADGTLLPKATDVGQAAAEEFGATLIEGFSQLGNQVLEVIEGAGIAVLKASEKTWFYISDQVADRRVPAVAVGWAMLVYAITAATIYNRIKKA
jgi:hypothetical protein